LSHVWYIVDEVADEHRIRYTKRQWEGIGPACHKAHEGSISVKEIGAHRSLVSYYRGFGRRVWEVPTAGILILRSAAFDDSSTQIFTTQRSGVLGISLKAPRNQTRPSFCASPMRSRVWRFRSPSIPSFNKKAASFTFGYSGKAL
jgi:hypothetical protein